MNPLVSVIIPVYNGEKFLEEAIRSVIDQDYSSWELLIVDDGSTDTTASIAGKFAADIRVKYYFQDNAGVSSARNNGVRNATGDFFAFMDADDVWLGSNLLEKVNYLVNNPNVGLVHSHTEIINESSVRTGIVKEGKEGWLLDELLLWQNTSINAPSSILIRKEVMTAVGVFDEELSTAADQDFYFRIAQKYAIGNIQKVLVLYRTHPNNMSSVISRMETDHLGVYSKAKKNKLFKSYRFRQECFSNLYLTLAGSWWVNGNNKGKGMYYLLRAMVAYPPNIVKVIRKAVR